MLQNTNDFTKKRKREDERALSKRFTELQGRGLEKEKIEKDPRLRHLRARIRQAKRRLAAIAGTENRSEAEALRKAENKKGESLSISQKIPGSPFAIAT